MSKEDAALAEAAIKCVYWALMLATIAGIGRALNRIADKLPPTAVVEVTSEGRTDAN